MFQFSLCKLSIITNCNYKSSSYSCNFNFLEYICIRIRLNNEKFKIEQFISENNILLNLICLYLNNENANSMYMRA